VTADRPTPVSADLAGIGWDDAWARLAASSPGDDPGRVLQVDRGLATVCTATGPVRVGLGGGLLQLVAADRVAAPATGDWVMLRTWPDQRVTLERVLPRRTGVVRAGAGKRAEGQVLVSNATVAAVVVGAVPDPGVAKIERLLALAWTSGARPLLVLAKADLAPDATDVLADLAADAPGVETVAASSRTGQGIDRLRATVGDSGTLALLGSSGVGKSSLANAMVGAPVLRTRRIRTDGRGRHTSVRRELVRLPGGGCVVDTPGLRGVGMAGTDAGAAAVFTDVAELATVCRFDDCSHRDEPGCAVAAAVDSGVLPLRRLEAWRRLQRELAWMEQRQQARRRRTRRRVRPAGPTY
jgi:ribosome biogenesis GTPase